MSGKNLNRQPLHQQIAAILREEIAGKHKPGDKLEAESALAKRFAVSVLTVREALSSLAQAGLVVRRHGSGTYVSEPSSTGHLAVVTDTDIANPNGSYFWLRVVQQLRERMEATGRPVRVYVGKGNPPGARPERPNCPEFNADADAGLIAGIAAVATVPHPRWLKPLAKRGIPVVGDGAHEYAVNTDYVGMVHQAIDRLVSLGRKRIAVLGCGGSNANDGMVLGVRHALNRHGIIRRDGWIRFRPWHQIMGAGWEEMRALWAEKEKPDGLFVTDDMLFLDVQTAITQLGIEVPKKLWVIAHGNQGSLRQPPFPCERIVFDPDLFAEAMAERLLRLLRGEAVEPKQSTIPAAWEQATLSSPLERTPPLKVDA